MNENIDRPQPGFKCGLEIHQQLDTKRKLFCRCPVGLRHDQPDARIVRHMRPTLSELGEYDGTALMEFKTKKDVIYELYSQATCTYEMDDTPPFRLNPEALDIAIEMALMLNCNLVDEIHISRKQYLDGSIPTGFQRTAIVGTEGWIPFKGRRFRIIQVTLEEDACREVSDVGHTITFRTDRLSTPLVEITTYPDARTPEEAQEVNEALARVLRATGKVRRGIGAARQDVNVSIDGGTRVEIKGVPRYKYVKRLTEVEAYRQSRLLELQEILRGRGISSDTLHGRKVRLDPILRNLRSPLLRRAISEGLCLGAIKLCGFAGLLNHPTQPGYTFADELSGRVRVIACLDQRPNLVHSDAPEAHGVLPDDWSAIRAALEAKPTDVVVVVWGGDADTDTALAEIKIRALEATQGVPNETRQAFADGHSDFERILPGPDRMYPDTDSAPTPITLERLEKVESRLVPRPWAREEKYLGWGLSLELARPLSYSPRATLFETLVEESGLKPSRVASILLLDLRYLRRMGVAVDHIAEESLREAIERLSKAEAPRSVVRRLITALANGAKPVAQLADEMNLPPRSREEIARAIRTVLKDHPSISPATDRTRHFLIGRVIKRLGGAVSGRVVSEILGTEGRAARSST
ncbi:MAG: Glu-tRNA(Gln) amidotransferase subunit GatE [Candidatus Eisenbacteria sp.]|nr:Glu-tRNA(Gln) amidotransferase subunit GatE [Candidatus Eisenbacteria bacterium]